MTRNGSDHPHVGARFMAPSAIHTRRTLEDTVPADLFKGEVRAWARRIDVTITEIHLRPMTRKWASCSSRGRLTFDTTLLRQPAPFRAEVIVHELLHLKVPNHSALFRSLLRAHLADAGITAALASIPPRK